MSGFSTSDHEHMARALRLARRGLYTAHPNPRVGCVLVREGAIVGEGWHRQTGGAHAEVHALRMANDKARGSTAYVTLEPCSHQGKTPPCVLALLEAGVAEVVAAMPDPDPRVSGSGFDQLRSAGITVRRGLMETEARQLNEGFACRIEQGRPLVRVKIAASLDGNTAMANGQSQWITGQPARHDVQKLRAASGAVLTGIATVAADDPSLTVRDDSIEHGDLQPLRVVLDSQLAMSPTARMLALPGSTAIFCVDDRKRQRLEEAGAQVHVVPDADGKADLAAVMRTLGEWQINDVLVEAGPTLTGALVDAGLVDELVIYLAPHMMGSETRGMLATPGWIDLGHRLELKFADVRTIGRDLRITARPAGTELG